jgi:WhiB family redox-sensing transcriptional regulator
MSRPRLPEVAERERAYAEAQLFARILARLRPGPDQMSWFRRAACRKASSAEIFYPDHDVDPHGPDSATLTGMAKTFCWGDDDLGREPCPVRRECLAYAMERGDKHGIWGGYTWPERHALRRTGYEMERDRNTRSLTVVSSANSTPEPARGTVSETAV